MRKELVARRLFQLANVILGRIGCDCRNKELTCFDCWA